jgi:SAM-dependent methyltransferase
LSSIRAVPDGGGESGRFAVDGQEQALLRMERARHYNEWLLARCRPYLGRRVLDAGAGTGTFAEMLADEHEVVAAEPDPQLAAVLRRRFAGRANVRVLELEAAALPDDDGVGFDSIVSFNVLEHIPDDEAALRAFSRLLVPGGTLLLLVPAHPFLFGRLDGALGHERRYDEHGLRSRLEAARLELQVLRHVNPVGALGWLVLGRVLGVDDIPVRTLELYDRLVPLLRALDAMKLPFGLSLWAVARKPRP